ncbi:AAA family ATPase [Methylobacterium sp. J-070]|uniref:AAA family ATPase n=1 Tax=Methylobacterium sp. J-070 TaxID=2836650 RepID=UPI001FBB8DFB|nr:AAA family ATPase [Methylobacterium sp. J-070]MCJ2049293.1 AAA family ATPase [Methylobacterium sp. J-070]
MSDGATESGATHRLYQRVVGLIGCPGSDKTTYARRFDPLDGWVHLTLDDLQQAIWPPDRQVYWQVRKGSLDEGARRVLHSVKEAALEAALAASYNEVLADTHLIKAVFARELKIMSRYGITIEWKLFNVPWDVLYVRNEERNAVAPAHRQPEYVLRLAYDAMCASDAWWRTLPPEQIETILI